MGMRCHSSRPITLPLSSGSSSCGCYSSCLATGKLPVIRDNRSPPCSNAVEYCSIRWDRPAAPFWRWFRVWDCLAEQLSRRAKSRLPESSRGFARAGCHGRDPSILTRPDQHEFESSRPEFINYSRQGFQHDMRSTGQMIVQQDDVPACRLLQDAPGENRGIPAKRIAATNAPGNVLQSGVLQIAPQKRMALAYWRAEQTRTESTNAAYAFRATLDLCPQTCRREKTK